MTFQVSTVLDFIIEFLDEYTNITVINFIILCAVVIEMIIMKS